MDSIVIASTHKYKKYIHTFGVLHKITNHWIEVLMVVEICQRTVFVMLLLLSGWEKNT